MTEYTFANKAFFFLLLLIPLLVLWNIFLSRRGKRFILFSSKSIIRDSNHTWKTFFIKNLIYVKLFALALFIVALARPQALSYYDTESKKGIDILVTLDVSGTMASMDFQPRNRLTVAKDIISDFIKKRSNDRIGLVAFAGQAYTKCPLTIDYEILRYFLKQTEIGELEDGTAIGMALATSVNRIRYSKSKSKIIILLTDGNNNKGEIDPRDAARIAKDFNVKVYTIGVGTRGEAQYPMVNEYGETQYVMVPVEIDEDLLKYIANTTGGIYFRATDQQQLKNIFAEIDRWEKTEISTRRYYNTRDLYLYFLLAGFGLLMLAEFARRTVLKTLP